MKFEKNKRELSNNHRSTYQSYNTSNIFKPQEVIINIILNFFQNHSKLFDKATKENLKDKIKNSFVPKFEEESNINRKLNEFYPINREYRNKSSVKTVKEEYNRILNNKIKTIETNDENDKTFEANNLNPKLRRILDLNPNINKEKLLSNTKVEKKENSLKYNKSSSDFKYNSLTSSKENRIQNLKSNIFNLKEKDVTVINAYNIGSR